MEAMDICLATVRDVSHVIWNHPLYSAVGGFVLFIIILRFYCRLTLGICECQQELGGKTVLITGASAGIGRATACDLARRQARVLLACRNVEKAEKVAEDIRKATGNQQVLVKHLDLCSFDSVRKCAQDILDNEKRLDILINNAGIAGSGRKIAETEDGCEIIMQSNHLGHFLFTLLLMDLIKRSSPSRIINVSSMVHYFEKFNAKDLNNKRRLDNFALYSNSKLANILFTNELAKRLAGTGVTVNALHPGCVKTDIIATVKGIITNLTKIFIHVFGKSSEEGAQTTIHLAVSPELEGITGKYFSDCKEANTSDTAKDAELAKQLFLESERIVGQRFLINGETGGDE